MKKVRMMVVAAGGMFMSVSAFAQYSVVTEAGYAEAAVNPGAALMGVTDKMSTVSDDYGKTASVLGSFYDNMNEQSNMEGSAVYFGGGSEGGGNSGNGDSVTFPKTGGGPIGPVPMPADGEVVGENNSLPTTITIQGLFWPALNAAIKGGEAILEKTAEISNREGERRAKEGKEKQRAAEEKWEGKARNYPELNK